MARIVHIPTVETRVVGLVNEKIRIYCKRDLLTVLFSNANSINKLPDGYCVIPISKCQRASVLKIAVLVRQQPDPLGGHLVLLRDTLDAKIYLGCTIDACSKVLDWVEIWIQDFGTLANSNVTSRLPISNTTLDQRWHQQVEAFESLDGVAMIKTGWETSYPLPTLLDMSSCSPLHPKETDSGSHWQLCTDEGLLHEKDLPGYGSSLHRYLYLPDAGNQSRLIPVTTAAPENASTIPLSHISGNSGNIIPFNIAAGLMMVKQHHPVDLETYIEVLSNASWDGLKHGSSVIDLGAGINALRKHDTTFTSEGRMLLESHGQCGKLIESFHLKLRLFADLVSSVHTMTSKLQRPFFNINPQSWQVYIGHPGRGLPILWTARAIAGNAGESILLAIEGSDRQYYLPSPDAGTSIYRPVASSILTRGRTSVRIRQVLPDTGDKTIIEGTLSTRERIDPASHDLVWLRINLAHGQIDLYAHLEADSAMAQGEWRFRTIGQDLKEIQVSDLKSAEGVPLPGIQFEIIPLLSSPCDLYSLGVMAVRIFLTDNTTNLPVALDETLSLVRQVESGYNEEVELPERIKEMFGKDERWIQSLGPHRLTYDNIAPEEAINLITPQLWLETLSLILRMFSGMGPDSQCSDYGDAQQGGLHKVFEPALAKLDELVMKTRSLIVSDWKSNYQIRDIIKNYTEE